jgi:hydrogenase maturation protease
MIATQGQPGLVEALGARLVGRVILVGVGNPLFGDDAAGCLTARGLKGTAGLDVIQADDAPERHVVQIADRAPDVVVLVDAVELGAPVGSVAILEKEAMARYEASTHRVPLGLLAEFIERSCGADVFIIAIQPGHVELGANVSPQVTRSVELLRELIRQSVDPTDDSTPRNVSPGNEAV